MRAVSNPSTEEGEARRWSYNALDCLITHQLFNVFDGNLRESRKTYDFERSLLRPLSESVHRGIVLDNIGMAETLAALKARCAALQAYIGEMTLAVCGEKINHRSHQQVKRFLYEVLLVPVHTKADRGEVKVTTNEEALESIGSAYLRARAFCKLLLKLRELEKMMQFFDKDGEADGRFRCGYNIGGTVTGRLSSSESAFDTGMNFQNIPHDIRSVFRADPGYTMVYADLKSAESFCVGYLSEDAGYIRACKNDIHTYVAAMVFGISPEEVRKTYYKNKSYRDISKMCGHASNYLGKARTIAIQGKIETKIAEDFQQRYFDAFPGIRIWQEETVARLLDPVTGPVLTTPLGRKRTFHGRLGDEATHREAIAFVPQSMVGDILNIGLVNVYNRVEEAQILGNIHDAILLQIPTVLLPRLIPEISDCLRVPVRARGGEMVIPSDIKIGNNWGNMVSWKETIPTS